MSVHVIYYKDGAKMMRPVLNRKEYLRLRGSAEQQRLVAAARNGDVSQKGKLVQMNYSCLPNDDGSLKGTTRMSTSVGMDIDFNAPEALSVEEVAQWLARQMAVVPERVLAVKDELGLLMLERSATKGYHLVFRRRRELTQEENLQWASQLLGVKYDDGAKDITRVFYTTTEKDLVYLDDKIFCQAISTPQAHPLPPQTHPHPLPRGGEIQNVQRVQNEQEIQNEQRVQNEQESQTMQDVPNGRANQSPLPSGGDGGGFGGFGGSGESGSVTRIRFIARGVMKEKGLVESDFLDEGGRHTSVKMFLSGATQLLTKEETNGVLQELMPEHWNDANIQQLVSDFYQNYTNPSQRLLKYQEELFVKSRRLAGECEGDAAAQPDPASGLGEALPRFPRLIQLLTSRTPDVYKAAVAHAVFPPLATHLCGVRFRYTDNVEHEATLMNCLMAGTGTGKGCIDKPIDHIMADIRLRDKENERREGDWKKDCQRKGANKDKMVRPEGLVIQEIDSDMTKPALVTRMDEAEGHFVYVKLNELDLFEQLRGQTGKQHFQLMCLAFDSGATYGQTRVGVQSVTARPECRFNWNACTTVLKGRRFFSRVLTDGPISRINFCTIPEQEIGSEQPVYGEYDAAFDEALKPYIDNLTSARGLIDCPQAFRLARKLQQECAEFARLSQSQTYWNLSHRACVIAWLKACVLYVANGQKWERSIEEFIRWSLRYDMSCKMLFFGADIERAEQGDEARIGRRGPRNLLELLPDEFTLDDARRVRQQQGISNEGYSAIRMIRTWVNRGYVIQNTEYSFLKSEKYKGKI